MDKTIPCFKAWKAHFGLEKAQAVYDAVKTKLATWESLPLEERYTKLKYEIQWVEENKKYDTWEVAKNAYEKQYDIVNYQIGKKYVKNNASYALEFVKTTKSEKAKGLAEELNKLLDNNASFQEMQDKANQLNNVVAKLEVAEAKRQAAHQAKNIITLSDIPEDEIKKLLDKFKIDTVYEIDGIMRKQTEEIWKTLTLEEKNVLTKYTQTFNYLNEPLRGLPYYGSTIPNAEHVRDLPILTKAISKVTLPQNMVVRRGVDDFTIKELGYGLDNLKAGDVFTDKGFLSTSMHRNKGFSNRRYNFVIVVPKGAQGIYAEPFSHYTDNYKSLLTD